MSLYYVVIKTMWRDDYHRQDCWSEAGPDREIVVGQCF